MNLYTEVMGISSQSQCLSDNASSTTCSVVAGQEPRRSNSYPKPKSLDPASPHKDNNTSILKSCSLNSKDLPVRRHPVQRAASRLYRTTSFLDSRTKYCTPRTCIGPEFIVRAASPSKIIHISRVKVAQKRRVVVVMLNGQKLDISCNGSSTTAKELFEVVVQSENLEENFMLGLTVLLMGDFVFIPPDIKLCKVAPACWLKKSCGVPLYTFTMYIRVKLFVHSLRGVRSWGLKHMLYLQLRRLTLEQHMVCSLEQTAMLAGLALQAEFGDYDDLEHGCGDYFLLEHYVADSLVQSGQESRVKALLQQQHRRRRGLDPGQAEEAFIFQLQLHPSYGSHFHAALLVNKERTSIPMWLVVSSGGISLYSRHSDSNRRELMEHFMWKNIQKLSCSKSFFFLQSVTRSSTKLKLRMDNRKSCYAFHLASLHHKFFLKLKVEFASLPALSAAFGVRMRPSPEREQLYQVEGEPFSKVPVLDKWQYGLLTPPRPSPPSRANIQSAGSWHTHVEETQNKENELPDGCPTMPLLRANKWDRETSSDGTPAHIVKPVVSVEPATPSRARVKMGTRAYTSSQQQLFLPVDISLKICNDMTESSIKLVDENFYLNMQESLSESFLQKFNSISFLDERVLKNVRLERDKSGGLGIQIIQGSDGGVYIQSVLPNRAADQLGAIHKGDQIMAVNGHSLLNMNFQQALQFIQSLDGDIEVLLSQNHSLASPGRQAVDMNVASPETSCCATEPVAFTLKSSRSRTLSPLQNCKHCIAPPRNKCDHLSENSEETFL